jgi:hypothetical protein
VHDPHDTTRRVCPQYTYTLTALHVLSLNRLGHLNPREGSNPALAIQRPRLGAAPRNLESKRGEEAPSHTYPHLKTLGSLCHWLANYWEPITVSARSTTQSSRPALETLSVVTLDHDDVVAQCFPSWSLAAGSLTLVRTQFLTGAPTGEPCSRTQASLAPNASNSRVEREVSRRSR